MKKNLHNKVAGFTLIELLVVIAIIGILSSVVLVSLNSARNKGKDTHIISAVSQARTVMESLSNGSDYSGALTGFTATAGTYTGGLQLLLTADAAAGGKLAQVITDATSTNGGTFHVVYVTNGTVPTKYVIYGGLPSQSGQRYFCMDSTGNSNALTASGAATSTLTACP
ncbi:MAG: type II secretion system protein [Candidatus Taylorbacteria bacterium]